VIGANTGGVYVFSRQEKKLLQIAFAEKVRVFSCAWIQWY